MQTQERALGGWQAQGAPRQPGETCVPMPVPAGRSEDPPLPCTALREAFHGRVRWTLLPPAAGLRDQWMGPYHPLDTDFCLPRERFP